MRQQQIIKEDLRNKSMNGKTYIDKTAIVHPRAQIGENTRIWQFCNIMEDAHIGKECNIGQGCYIENHVKIGNHVTIKNNVALYEGVECADNVFLGPNCVFTNVKYPRSFVSRKDEFKKTIIEEGVSIGANATIVCGVRIGKYALIGAGCVVTKDIPEYALMLGNPAKQNGFVCRCGEKLEKMSGQANAMYCARCRSQYRIENSALMFQEGDK